MESSTTKATNGIPFSSGQGTPPETVASRRSAHKRKRGRYLTEVTRDRDSQEEPDTPLPGTAIERKEGQASSSSLVSSIFMSLNSLDSKISPHSRHSTNSASSSRDTICTRGCLHAGMLLLFSGTCGGGIRVINPGLFPGPSGPRMSGAPNWRYFSPAVRVVKYPNVISTVLTNRTGLPGFEWSVPPVRFKIRLK